VWLWLPALYTYPAVACASGVFYGTRQLALGIAPEMRLPEHFDARRRHNWCTVVVLVAICSLTVSLATRYCSPTGSSAYSVRTVVKRSSTDGQRQRLAKDAADWIAPVLCSTVLQAATSYPRIAPAAPRTPNPLSAEALYNRPPPSFESLA